MGQETPREIIGEEVEGDGEEKEGANKEVEEKYYDDKREQNFQCLMVLYSLHDVCAENW